MTKTITTIILIGVTALAIRAQAPDSLSFQGVLTDDVGDPIDKTGLGLIFTLYKGGSPIWTETQSVDVVDGLFNVYLGKNVVLDTVAFDQPIDLGITIDGKPPELSPRTPLVTAAWARALPGFYTRYREHDTWGAYTYNIVGGADNNEISSVVVGGTISGGGGIWLGTPKPNKVKYHYGTIGGGHGNTANGGHATIAGGSTNTTGITNSGSGNHYASVGGGYGNAAGGGYATISGGKENVAFGDYSAIPGGLGNQAAGHTSFAAGHLAKAAHDGAFVWQDSSGTSPDTLWSKASSQFVARASGGFYFYTEPSPGLKVGAELPSGSGSWGLTSSESTKTRFRDVDPDDYLKRVASLDIREWGYKTEDPAVSHVGPMSEDFHAVFGHGPSDLSISAVDADGVALAAIQGLYRIVMEQQARIAELEARLDP